MKILFILTYYSPHWTGLTQHAKALAEGLVKLGHQVSVLTTQHEKHLPQEEQIQGVKVIRKPIWFRLSRTLISPALIVGSWREILSHQRIVIYLPFAESIIAVIIAKLLGKKVYLVHNGDLVLPKGLFNRILEFIYFYTTNWSMNLADKVIVYTLDYAHNSKLLKKHLARSVPILPPVPKEKVDPEIQQELRQKIGKKSPVIGFAGRFVEEKGFDVLLRAIPLVKQKFPNCVFVFAGETKMEYEDFYGKNINLIENNKNNLVMVGKLDHQEMASFYSLLDVFVLPSRTDCLAIVQVEAMLSGVPVVASDIPGARVPVKITGMGKLIKKENPETLALGIIEVLKNKSSYSANKIKVEKIFSFVKIINSFEDVLF